jgi:hypothetical protein
VALDEGHLSATGPAAGAGWNSSTTEGQLPAARSSVHRRQGQVAESSIAQLESMTGDRDVAYSAAFGRAVERGSRL